MVHLVLVAVYVAFYVRVKGLSCVFNRHIICAQAFHVCFGRAQAHLCAGVHACRRVRTGDRASACVRACVQAHAGAQGGGVLARTQAHVCGRTCAQAHVCVSRLIVASVIAYVCLCFLLFSLNNKGNTSCSGKLVPSL